VKEKNFIFHFGFRKKGKKTEHELERIFLERIRRKESTGMFGIRFFLSSLLFIGAGSHACLGLIL
jgi:hypothetical protein